MLLAHWDHLGSCGTPEASDRICNGAVDNASGIAMMLAIARRLGAGPKLDRDVLILATTAEEQGLLGAYHFVADPPVPLASIAVAFNIDTDAIAPRGAPVAMIGEPDPWIIPDVTAIIRAQGRAVVGDDEADFLESRQDGWALAQAGVPAIMVGSGIGDVEALNHFLDGAYHTVADQLSDATELGGAAEDADLHVDLVRHFASIAAFSPPAMH